MNNENVITKSKGIENIAVLKFNIYLFIKRITDILASIVCIVVLIPLTLIVKIAYMISGDFHSVFYFHERIGKNGKPFKMFKFRTMVTNSQEILEEMLKDKKYRKEWEEYHKFEDDPRITKMGKILRKTSLDEIPQIINIFKGDMSLVGPRPMIEEEVDAYGKKIVPHGLRHNFATVGIRAGMDIASLALMMGHASRAMTLDTYGDANADALTLASVKLKDTFNDNTDYFKLEEEQGEIEEE